MKPIIIIPDIHGCLELLEQVVNAYPDHDFAFLGDLIDRGPDTPGVIALIRRLHAEGRVAGMVKGNHEDMAFSVLLDGNTGNWETWLGNGGVDTFRQYQGGLYARLRQDMAWLRHQMKPFLSLETPMGQLLLAHASRPSAFLYNDVVAEDPSIWDREHLWVFEADQPDDHWIPEGHEFSVHGHRILSQPLWHAEQKAMYLDVGPAAFGKLAVLDTGTGASRVFTTVEEVK
jgi:serine/threonine protein phosphatase 1